MNCNKLSHSNDTALDYAALLQSAVTEPGKVATCYSAFWNYSLGNQMLALEQCASRGIKPGPIATFVGWQRLGRFVKKGQKAIVLCMPVTMKKPVKCATVDATEQNHSEKTVTFTRFLFKPNWFVLAQTDGDTYAPPPIPGFEFDRALKALNIERIDFSIMDGNCQGYAEKRSVAVSPVAAHPDRTLLHEVAHIVLGHTGEGAMSDHGEQAPHDIRELEAEAASMLCCAALGIRGIEESRGYIQSWFHSKSVPEQSARRIFQAADSILKAGRGEDYE